MSSLPCVLVAFSALSRVRTQGQHTNNIKRLVQQLQALLSLNQCSTSSQHKKSVEDY